MPDAFIYDAMRTPRGRGKSSGALYSVRPVDLLAQLLKTLQARHDLPTAQVDDVIMGCVTETGEQGACIARFAALQAGWDFDAPGMTMNRFCGSGLQAVNSAAAWVMSGMHDLVVAGGVESMSRVKMGSDGGAIWDVRTQFDVGSVPQGISADLIATLRGLSRRDVDSFAAESQRRTAAAVARGALDRGLVPVVDAGGQVILAADEHPRPDTTVDSLGALSASFQTMGQQFQVDALVRSRYPQVDHINHVHTAGNSSGIVDGAAALLVGSEAVGQRLGLTPRARIRSTAVCGEEPIIMLTGPVPATRKALKRAGMEIGDVDLFEVNEAFAVVPLMWMEDLGVSHDRVNVNGGAIAMGHPLGATGAILLGTVLDELESRDLNTGLVTLCIGGGMGIATIIERV